MKKRQGIYSVKICILQESGKILYLSSNLKACLDYLYWHVPKELKSYLLEYSSYTRVINKTGRISITMPFNNNFIIERFFIYKKFNVEDLRAEPKGVVL